MRKICVLLTAAAALTVGACNMMGMGDGGMNNTGGNATTR